MTSSEIYIVNDTIEEYKIKNVKIQSILENITDSLKVYINDEELLLNEDYIIEKNILKFNNRNLLKGDKICIRDSISKTVKKVASRNPSDTTCVYHLFTSSIKYKFNHNYNMVLCYGLDAEIKSNFLTKFNPYYISVQKIRMDVGDFLNNTADEVIARVIYDNSKLANELSKGNESEANSKVPVHVKNFVRYKTDIDLCNSAYLTLSGKAGSVSKSIGDLTINKDVKIPYLKDLLKKFEELLKPNDDLLSGKFAKAKAVRKANSKNYPISNRGIF